MTPAAAALTAYLVIINIAAFSLYALDKSRARRRMWRVPERTLMLMTALGGSLGSLLAMHLLHHKTKTPKFEFGIPVLLMLHAALLAYVYWRLQ